jgi:anti-anti-sigma factor
MTPPRYDCPGPKASHVVSRVPHSGIRMVDVSGLDIDVAGQARGVLITLTGEFNLATCPEVRAAAILALQPGKVAEIVIDLTAVTMIDSTGLGCLVDIRKVARQRNIALRLRGLQNGSARNLEMIGPDREFGPDQPADVDPR